MTKLDPAALAQGTDDLGAAIDKPGSSEAVVPANPAAPETPAEAKLEAEKKHGPTTTMKSGWASGG